MIFKLNDGDGDARLLQVINMHPYWDLWASDTRDQRLGSVMPWRKRNCGWSMGSDLWKISPRTEWSRLSSQVHLHVGLPWTPQTNRLHQLENILRDYDSWRYAGNCLILNDLCQSLLFSRCVWSWRICYGRLRAHRLSESIVKEIWEVSVFTLKTLSGKSAAEERVWN
jgi:hypothetical protein